MDEDNVFEEPYTMDKDNIFEQPNITECSSTLISIISQNTFEPEALSKNNPPEEYLTATEEHCNPLDF
ncbi:3829_t:CDS:2 [Cetraspora pellucida]|uniref:3829_t:CDS:1 n=1 Tax=Cetraspora pellucida TaxID=1433469 RepID=A0A9N9BHG6_9GLOM|nr:3829_t:CDS:2 [Cetraspora pellucida]